MLLISKDRCVGCGLCESECPVGAISVDVDEGIAVIEMEKCVDCNVCAQNCPQYAIKDIREDMVFAIGTDDGSTIKQDDHFGMSKAFQIWKYSQDELVFQEQRDNVKYEEDETRIHGDPEKAKATSSVLEGVDIIVGKMMGPNIVRLKQRFVPVIVRSSGIDEAVGLIRENLVDIACEKEKTDRRGLIIR